MLCFFEFQQICLTDLADRRLSIDESSRQWTLGAICHFKIGASANPNARFR
jgi:hypothetical protein